MTTTSPTPVPWALTIDLAQPPFNGANQNTLSSSGRRRLALPDRPRPAVGRVRADRGPERPCGRETIVAGQSLRVEMCDWNLPAGVDTPSAYTVATRPGARRGPPRNACLDTTVTGNGTSQFYVGWSAQVDMAPAIARLAQAGQCADAWTFGGTEWMVQRTQTEPDDVRRASRPARRRSPGPGRSRSRSARSTTDGAGRGRWAARRAGRRRSPEPPMGIEPMTFSLRVRRSTD